MRKIYKGSVVEEELILKEGKFMLIVKDDVMDDEMGEMKDNKGKVRKKKLKDGGRREK